MAKTIETANEELRAVGGDEFKGHRVEVVAIHKGENIYVLHGKRGAQRGTMRRDDGTMYFVNVKSRSFTEATVGGVRIVKDSGGKLEVA